MSLKPVLPGNLVDVPSSGGGSSGVSSVNNRNGDVILTKGDVGLSSVQNISPADMPVSDAAAAALSSKAPVTHLSLVSDVATWVDPSGIADLKIAAPKHGARIDLSGDGPLMATLFLSSELPSLLAFGGDASGLLPLVCQAGSISVISISRASGGDFVVNRISETLINKEETPVGSPVLALRPAFFANITSTSGAASGAGRAVNKWVSEVGSEIAQSTGLYATRPNLQANGPRGEYTPFGDGADAYTMASNITGSSGAYTLFFAVRPTALGAGTLALWSAASGSPPPYLGITAAGQLSHYNGSTSLTSVPLPSLITNGWVVLGVRYGSASRDLFVNLTKIASTTGGTQNLVIAAIGQLAAGSNQFIGDIGEVIAYDGYLSNSDCAKELTRLCKRWRTRSRFVDCDGNSLTAGNTDGEETGAAVDYPLQLQRHFSTRDWVLNYGVSGQTTPQMSSDAAAQIDPFAVRMDAGKNICVAWEIGNDLAVGGSNATTAKANFASYCSDRRAAGFKVIAVDVPDRPSAGNLDATSRNDVNTWLLANYATFADALVRLTQVPQLEDKSNNTFRTSTMVHFYSTANALIAREVHKAQASIP